MSENKVNKGTEQKQQQWKEGGRCKVFRKYLYL